MSDLAHAIWAGAVVIVAIAAVGVAVVRFRLMLRQLELHEERRRQAESLAKRFDDVEKMANGLKVEWVNVKSVRGLK